MTAHGAGAPAPAFVEFCWNCQQETPNNPHTTKPRCNDCDEIRDYE